MMDPDTLLAYHNRHAWQPFNQMQLSPVPILIDRAEGARLFTPDGRQIIDGIGSWWTMIHGHNHPALMEAIRRQTEKLDHVIYSALTHEGALRLGAILSEKTEHHLPRVFYSDNGSTAVEIGLKMAYQYFTNRGQFEKTKILSMEGAYHGDTMGTMSVGGRSIFHKMYEPLLFDTLYVKQPVCSFRHLGTENEMTELEPAIQDLERVFRESGESLAAFIVEPLVQGASAGMHFYPAAYLKKARELCDRYNVFLIADEVFTGFGRTGSFFAFQQAGVWPDIMALAKGLTGGVLPLAVTMATEKIYEGFLSADRTKTLFHGHSMTGSPLGVAAALASVELFRTENRMEDVNRLWIRHGYHLDRIRKGPLQEFIRETRFLGSLSVIELRPPEGTGGYTSEFGWKFMERALARGVLLRPLGNSIYLAPPYVITDEELATVYGVTEELLIEMLTRDS